MPSTCSDPLRQTQDTPGTFTHMCSRWRAHWSVAATTTSPCRAPGSQNGTASAAVALASFCQSPSLTTGGSRTGALPRSGWRPCGGRQARPRTWSCALSTVVWSCPQMSGPVHSCLDLSTVVWICPHMSGPVHSCLDLSTVVWICPHMSGPVHRCLVLSTVVWSWRLAHVLVKLLGAPP